MIWHRIGVAFLAAAFLLFANLAVRADDGAPAAAVNADAPPAPADGANGKQIFVTLSVNGGAGKDALVLLGDADIYVDAADLVAAGIGHLNAARVSVAGSTYVSLASLAPAVEYHFDQQAVTLTVSVRDGAYLDRKTDINVGEQPPQGVAISRERTAYANYTLGRGADGSIAGYAETVASDGRRTFRSSFSSLSVHGLSRDETSVTFDDAQRLRRTTLGDLTVSDANGTTSTRLFGVSVARESGLNPYTTLAPAPALRGTVLVPSTAEVYVNGALLSRSELAPGAYDVRNIPAAFGRSDAQIVLRDALGHTQVVTSTSFATPSLLRQGATDYEYGAGFLRSPSGLATYGRPAASARYRIGLSDAVTAGTYAAASAGTAVAGARAETGSRLGNMTLEGSLSTAAGSPGSAASFAYSNSFRRISVDARYERRTASYALIGDAPAPDRLLSDFSARLGVRSGVITTTVGLTRDVWRDAGTNLRLSLDSMVPLGRRLSLALDVARTIVPGTLASTGRGFNISATLLRMLPHSASVAATASRSDSGTATTLAVQRAAPLAGGVGFDATYASAGIPSVNGRFIASTPAFEADAAYRLDNTGLTLADTSIRGALVAAGGRIRPSRPISDAFALVSVPGVPGVDVMLDGQLIGRTGGDGDLVVPSLRPYFAERIAVSEAQMPLGTLFDETERTRILGSGAGTTIRFDRRSVRSFIGSLVVVTSTRRIVPAFGEMTLENKRQRLVSNLSETGGFYFENVTAGAHRARMRYAGGSCEFTLTVPQGPQLQTDLGTVQCDAP